MAVRAVALLALAWGMAYLTWRLGWSRGDAPTWLFVALLGAEAFGWMSLGFYAFLAWTVRASVRPPLPETLPSVDVFVCTYDEAVSVVEPTLIGCRAITVPHTTYLLDDGRRQEMRELAERLGAVYVTRPDNAHAKAGNINHALGVTRGELILALDADHVPRPDILDAVVGYFTEPDVALVQMPHEFFNRDSIQHTTTARHEQTLFFEVIGPGKDHHNAMFWCGSATVVRREALEDVGGVLTDTVAEDFHTTIRVHARGWRTRYHDEVLVQGKAPHDLASFLLQRARWAKGNLGVFRTPENPITCPGLTFKQRLSYLASLSNYFSGLQRLALLAILAWTLFTGVLPMHASLATLVLLWLPWSSLALLSTVALGRGTIGPFDSTRFGIMTVGIYTRGVVALLRRGAGKFKVTPKEGVDTGGLPVLRMLAVVTTVGVLVLVALSLRVAAVLNLIRLGSMPVLAEVIVIVLGVWEIGCIGAVVAPLVRRRSFRHVYRAPTQLKGRIDRTTTVVPIHDLTPEGLSFESPIELSGHVTLLTRLLDASGNVRATSLPVEVRWSAPNDAGTGYRIGGTFVELDTETHELLVEYCFVAGSPRADRAPEAAAPAAQAVATQG